MDKELSNPNQLKLFGDNFDLLPNALIIHGEPSIEEFEEAFRRLSLIEDATAWWWGDLCNAQEHYYGYVKDFCIKYERNYNSIRQYQWVCKAYELSMRIDSLSFNHHMIAAPLDSKIEWLEQAAENKWPTKALKLAILSAGIEKPTFDGPAPLIYRQNHRTWLPSQPDCDLLLTDPPYSTDVDQPIEEFAKWLPAALSKVKPSGHAYVFIGPYPREVRAYLNLLDNQIDLTQLLVWEYKNTMGPSPAHEYKSNWQAIIYYHGPKAAPLNCDLLLEKNAVHEFSMPRGGPSHHTWEKPTELAERFIRHSTKPGDIVIDCFAGTGTTAVEAERLGRRWVAVERN
ncbi:hypothetical protein LCGC14_1928150, partial [marine sediment metagenome]